MFGSHFYHQRIRKAVAVFGSLFNDIYVVRKNSSGSTVSQMKVPLSYAPKRDFLDRIDKMTDGEDAERQIAVKLPRMSFEITSMNYDATRQLPKMNNCIVPSTSFDGKARKIYSPVPYNIEFQLNVYAKSQDDALQIVEQILPFFTPQYVVSVNPIPEYDLVEDSPITFTGISFSDDYEGLLEARRSIIYTLTFEMKVNLYRDLSSPSAIILRYDIDFFNLEGTELFTTVSDSANVPYKNFGTLSEGSTFTEDEFKVRNVPPNITSFSILTPPAFGTASVNLGGTLTTVNGVVIAKGSWTYTPDSDYRGLDTFKVAINYGQDSSHFDVDVNVIVAGIKDAVDDEIAVINDAPLDFYVSGNDTFTGPVFYSIASGGEPENGTITVLNANTGFFRYTPNAGFTGTDTFIYRVTPTVGSSEIGKVTITVNAASYTNEYVSDVTETYITGYATDFEANYSTDFVSFYSDEYNSTYTTESDESYSSNFTTINNVDFTIDYTGEYVVDTTADYTTSLSYNIDTIEIYTVDTTVNYIGEYSTIIDYISDYTGNYVLDTTVNFTTTVSYISDVVETYTGDTSNNYTGTYNLANEIYTSLVQQNYSGNYETTYASDQNYTAGDVLEFTTTYSTEYQSFIVINETYVSGTTTSYSGNYETTYASDQNYTAGNISSYSGEYNTNYQTAFIALYESIYTGTIITNFNADYSTEYNIEFNTTYTTTTIDEFINGYASVYDVAYASNYVS
jgi:hypothetical protein